MSCQESTGTDWVGRKRTGTKSLIDILRDSYVVKLYPFLTDFIRPGTKEGGGGVSSYEILWNWVTKGIVFVWTNKRKNQKASFTIAIT